MNILNAQAPLVSVVVVNYHTPELVMQMVRTLSNPSIQIIISDNSPTLELEKFMSDSPSALYMKNERNIGFAAGVNRGIPATDAEWVYFLNTDALSTPSDILSLRDIAVSHNAHIAVPQLVKNDGTPEKNVGYFDGPKKNLFDWIFARPRLVDLSHHTHPIWVDLATGGALLVHKTVFEKIGTFDEKNFFMYFEDVDFSLRLKSHGMPILYVPAIKVQHTGGISSDKFPAEKLRNYQMSLRAYLTKHRGRLITWMNTKLKLFN
ncbi:MAG: glycosyltransferase family 2 protein [Candidatus Roizmanbacteria bacterium]